MTLIRFYPRQGKVKIEQQHPLLTINYLFTARNFDFKQKKLSVQHVSANTVVARLILFKQIVRTLQGFIIELSNFASKKYIYCRENALILCHKVAVQ